MLPEQASRATDRFGLDSQAVKTIHKTLVKNHAKLQEEARDGGEGRRKRSKE